MRKLIAHITLAVFLWASVVSPAKAVMPLLGAAAVWFFNQTAATQIAIGGSVALHAAVAAITFSSDTSQPNDTGSNKTLTVQLDPYVPLIAPASAGSQPATLPATSAEVVVSNEQKTYIVSGYCSTAPSGYSPSPSAACQKHATNYCKANFTATYNSVTNNNETCVVNEFYNGTPWGQDYKGISVSNTCTPGTTWNGSACVETQLTCPSGYTLSGSTCNLTNPTQASDNKKQVLRSGNTFSQDPYDPDVLPDNVTVTSNKVTVKNPNGRTDEIVIEPNGTLSTYHWEPNAAGDTVQTKVSASAPSAGSPVEVTGVETKTFSGSSSSTGGSTGTTTPTSQTQVIGDVQLDKTGLASDSKQCGYDAAHPCSVQLDTTGLGSNTLSSSGLDDASSAHVSYLESIGQGGEHGWTWDWNPLSTITTGTCSDPSFIINGKSYVDLTGFCDKVEWFRGFLEFMLYISTGIALFNIMTGRREEA